MRDAWAQFGIRVWPGTGIVGDRTEISEFMGKDASELANYQSDNNTWETLADVFMTPFGSGNLLGAQPAGSSTM